MRLAKAFVMASLFVIGVPLICSGLMMIRNMMGQPYTDYLIIAVALLFILTLVFLVMYKG